MEVLLKRAIEHLGAVGDVIKVKPGYARNHLLPLGYAVPVTKANLDEIETERARAVAAEKGRVQGIKELATLVAQTSVTLEGRANEDGHLFGSVTAAQIATALRDKGLRIEDRMIKLEHPLKEIGVFDVVVHLHQDVEAVAKVWVVQAKPE